jgi:hypothetical protein
MTLYIFLAATILLPIAIAIGLRVNAAVLFMSLCVGAVLNEYVSGSALNLAGNVGSVGTHFNESTLNLGLLLLPAVLTAAFMYHSVRGTRAMLNILPAIASGLLTAILTEPLLAPGSQSIISHNWLWLKVVSGETPIVAGGALVSLIFLWAHQHIPSSHHKPNKSKHQNA